MTSQALSKNDLYVYTVSDKILNSLELINFQPSIHDQLQDQQQQEQQQTTSKPKKPSSDSKLQEDDFQRYNRKRTSRGLKPLTEEEFDKLIEESSIESISGSESDSYESNEEDEQPDEDPDSSSLYKRFNETKIATSAENDESNTKGYLNTKTPFIYFKSSLLPQEKCFGLYKSFFTMSELHNDPLKSIDNWRTQLNHGKSALFMIGGGHFAGAIISHKRRNIGGDAINHKISLQEQQVEILKSKTFHRYTTRRKQGGSQGANDNAKGNAKSVGSNIRRYNEQALVSEVRELLKSWESDLNECQSIFIRANGSTGRKTLVGYEGAVLKHGDERIKNFPFTTKRATTSELKRAWTQLSYLSIESSIKEDEREKQRILQQQENLKKSQQKPQHSQHSSKELSESDKHSMELIGFMKRSKAPLLINYLKKNKLDVNFNLTPENHYTQTPTLLHFASSNGLSHMVQVLLTNLKADPTIPNAAGRVPAELSSNVSVKRSFQVSRFKLGEDYCNWDIAKVNEAKSKEEIEQEELKEQERIKLEKQQQLKEELANKTELEMKKPTFNNKGTVGGTGSLISDTSGLSEQQKMRVMREQRARAAEARMKKLQGK